MINEENNQEFEDAAFDNPLEIVTIGSQRAIVSPSEDQVYDFLVTVQPIVEQITGLSSRWIGHLRISDALNTEGMPIFSGRKEWNCDITLHRSRLSYPGWYSTALHEMIHSVSVGLNQIDYARFNGYEEGIVEQITRLLFGEIMSMADIGDRFVDRIPYQRYVRDLENLRKRTLKNEREFYLSLLAVSLGRREEVMVQWIVDANPLLSNERVISQMTSVLTRLKP